MQSPAIAFQDLVVWKKAHAFVLDVYLASKSFPRDELFGLTSQFRRAAVSIPANIAEGFGKSSKADKVRILNIAQGSLEECQYFIILAKDLGYFEQNQLWDLSQDVARLLKSYRSAIQNSIENHQPR